MGPFDQRVTNRTQPASQNRFSSSPKTVSGAAGSNARVQSYSQGMNFSKGQLLRGEIIDLRGRDIKLQLSSNQVLSGKINESMGLSIGESATFQVSEASASSVELKLVSDQRMMSEEITIDKALEAAGLPKSERNIAAVRELLGQGLSVDKNSIQELLKQSATFRGVSFHTLALMNKLSIPVTEVNVGQMEAYLNYEHRIMSLAEQTAGEISEAISSAAKAGSLAEAAALNQKVLALLADAKNLPPSALLSSFTADAPLSSFALLDSDGTLALLDALEPFGLSGENAAAFANGSITLRQASALILRAADQWSMANEAQEAKDADSDFGAFPEAKGAEAVQTSKLSLLRSLLQSASSLFGATEAESAANPAAPPPDLPTLAESAANPADPSARAQEENAREGSASPSAAVLLPGQMTLPEALNHLPVLFQTPEIFSILGEYAALARNSLELSSFLSKSQRMELSSQCKGKLPLTVLQKLEDGDLTAAELIKLLADAKSQAAPYLSSGAYQELLRQMLLNRFSMRPQDLSQKGAVEKYYESLDQDLNVLEKIQSRALSMPAFQDTAANIRDNIDFMKTLNQLFPYLQLPMKLSNQNAHAELYVYTKKEQLRRDPSSVSALLHLDMEQLGPLDIYLSLEQKKLQARFYLQGADNAAIVRENIPFFSRALAIKGYTLDARAEERKNGSHFLRDLLSPEQEGGSMKRYSFDIRA